MVERPGRPGVDQAVGAAFSDNRLARDAQQYDLFLVRRATAKGPGFTVMAGVLIADLASDLDEYEAKARSENAAPPDGAMTTTRASIGDHDTRVIDADLVLHDTPVATRVHMWFAGTRTVIVRMFALRKNRPGRDVTDAIAATIMPAAS